MTNTKTRSRSSSSRPNSSSDFRVCVKPADLANALAVAVNALAASLESASTGDEQQEIFAQARQMRIFAREATILSRFDRAVENSDFGGEFIDSDYNYGRWING